MFKNQQSSPNNKQNSIGPTKQSIGATKVRAHVAHTMLQVGIPPPPLTKDKPCLDRCLRTRYLPTQIPFSALPCSAYLSAEDVKQIAEVFKSFSVLPDTLRFNMNRRKVTNFSSFQREHLVDSFTPTNDIVKNTGISEVAVHLEQRSGGGPLQSTNRGGMIAESLGMEYPLKGTMPDDLAISKEWLVELLLASMARNYSNEQIKYFSINRNCNVASNTGTVGHPFHHSGKFDSGCLNNLQESSHLMPIGMTQGDSSLFGMTAPKDISSSLVFHKFRRFQQKQTVLTQFRRDLLRWIEPLQLIIDPDHNHGINERCKDQVDKLRFFHYLMRIHQIKVDDSVGLLSTTSTVPHVMTASKGVLAKLRKQEGRNGKASTKPSVSTRTSDPIYMGTNKSLTSLHETFVSNRLASKRLGADAALLNSSSDTNSLSRRSSAETLEGSESSSKLSITGPLNGISNTSNIITKDTNDHTNSTSGELDFSHASNDFSAAQTTRETNVPIFLPDDDSIKHENSAQLIYYGEQPDGSMSQTFKNILATSKFWEQFLLEWERNAELASALSESTNCSSNGAPLRRNNNCKRAVVCWRDFSNNLILPADCLPANALTNADAFPMDEKNINNIGNDFSSRYFCNDDTTGNVRGDAVYKRVLRVRLENRTHGAGGYHDRRHRFLAGDNNRSNEDNDFTQERDLKMDMMHLGNAQQRRRNVRVFNGAADPGRGFIAAANSIKGVASAAAAESDTLAEELKALHMQSADHVLVSTVHHRLITSSKDGLLKLWDSDWGNFVGNLLNVGTSWVLHMQFLHNELYLFIATSNAELTVLGFPSGAVLQKYRGCTTLVTALSTVVQPDLNGTKRFGLKLGECGPHRFAYRSGMPAKVFNNRLKDSRQVISETRLNAIPIEGFVGPTAVFLDPITLVCVFGTADGTIGGFDLSQYLKSSSILTSMNLNEPIPFFDKVQAHEPNTPVMGLCYNDSFQYVVSCGRDGSVSHIPLNSVLNIESSSNISRTFQRQIDTTSSHYFFGDATSSISSTRHTQLAAFCLPARLVATVHSDRRVLLWSMGRNTVDLVHRLSQETYDIVSLSFMPKDHLIAVLTADLVISIYDFKGFRPLSVIHVAKCNECNIEDLSFMTLRCPQDDADGCVAFFPGTKGRLVCALRGPVLFDRSENSSLEDPSGESKPRALPTSPKSEEPKLNPKTSILGKPQSPTTLPTPLVHSKKTDTQEKSRKNITHQGAIVDILLRRVRLSSSPTGTEGSACDNDTSPGRFELHTFSADWWRVWDPLKGELLREVNLCTEIRKQLPMFNRPLMTVCEWGTDACTRIIAGSRGGQVITLDASTGVVNNVEEVLVAQRSLTDSKRFVDRFHNTQTSRRVLNKKSPSSIPNVAYTSPPTEALDTDKRTSAHQPIYDPGNLFNLDATVVYHYGMHMLVCGSNRCVLRRYFTNDVNPSGEEQFIAMNFHLPATARTTITACCIVRDTHICLGTMDTRLFFYRMIDGSEPYAEEPLRSDIDMDDDISNSEPEIGAVIGLFFLNSSNQNLFVIVLDTGVMHVYSYLTNRSVARFRLHPAHECRIRKVIYHNSDAQFLICGDSLGRVRVLDISAFKSGTNDFRSAMKERFVFQGAPEEVSSLAFFSLPTTLPSTKFQEQPSKRRSLSCAMAWNDKGHRRSTSEGGLTISSAKEGDPIVSENSQVLTEMVTYHPGSSTNSPFTKPVKVDNHTFGSVNQDGLVVVGAGDGNVRLFLLQKKYERTRSLGRSSIRTSSPLDVGYFGARGSSYARHSFANNGSNESNTIPVSVSLLTNAPPIRDHESFSSRRRHHSIINISHVGTFGLGKWNAMNPLTFQCDSASCKTGEGGTILISSRCSRSSSLVVPEGQDEGFLDDLLLQAKKNVELNSHAVPQASQNALSIENRTPGSFHVSKKNAFDNKKRVGKAKKMGFKFASFRKHQRKRGKNMAATSSIPQRAQQEQYQHRDFRRRAASQREMKLLESILPRRYVAISFLASVVVDDLPTGIVHTKDKLLHRSLMLNGDSMDWFLCTLRTRRRTGKKYERNALLKMYPVSLLRKIEVIPNTCKIPDYHEDGSPRIIQSKNAFSRRWDLLSLNCGDSNKDIDIYGTSLNSERILSKDSFSESIKMTTVDTSQDSSIEEAKRNRYPTLVDAISSGNNNESTSLMQDKTILEPSDGGHSSFITDLNNITSFKMVELIKTDDSSNFMTDLPTLCPTNAFTVVPEEGQSRYSQLNERDVALSPFDTQPTAPTLVLHDPVEASVIPNDFILPSSPLYKSMNSGTLSGRTLQHRESGISERCNLDKRTSNMNKPVFVGGRALSIVENLTTSVSSLAENVLHSPKSINFNDSSSSFVKYGTKDDTHNNNALRDQIQTALSDLSASAVEQRYEQTILAHLAHQLDRVRPSGHAPGVFTNRVKQIWQQRAIEDASQAMILSITNPTLRSRVGSPQVPACSTARKNRFSPATSSKIKGSPKKEVKQQCYSGLFSVPNHAMAQKDPGIGLNLAILTLPTDKKSSIVSGRVRNGTAASVSAAAKDSKKNFDKASVIPAHERVYQKLRSWRHNREQEVAERRRVIEYLSGLTSNSKASKHFSSMPNRLTYLPLLYAQQTLEPVNVPAPSVIPRSSEDVKYP
ncbi:unnamed protein product [Phytomonas sp. Hart1]|nr:unnamed protein product [Phytomonas sp. Hart1]|eukprot:CCW65987.1 unnamed protein product [Phytomonas sp. isolate Hart1]